MVAFWWVNHKQTVRQETEGGYIWSPKQNANGAKNVSYDNLAARQVVVADVLSAIGILFRRLDGAPFRFLPNGLLVINPPKRHDQTRPLVSPLANYLTGHI